jgi:hydrogenase maturation factor HypF (carbamoyltransferase family)
MAKWKEVSAYTGENVEEDAPTNNAGSGAVSMPPDAMMKKKKKSLLDARTKSYKQHQAKLETARQKRLESKKSKFIDKVKESINDFERESFITEDNVDVLRSIVKNKQNKSVKFQDGKKAKVDLFTASALTQVLDKVNADNKAKLTKMINGTLKSFLQAQSAVMKLAKMK